MENPSDVIDIIRSQFPGSEKIVLHQVLLDGNEEEYVIDAIKSNEVSVYGKYLQILEKGLFEHTRSSHNVLVSSGTAALQMALKLVGVQGGEEVLTQSLTFVSTANTITYNQAYPVFLDVDEDSMGLSPEALRIFLEEYGEVRGTQCFNKMSGRRIAACLPVHVHGFVGSIDKIVAICRKWQIPVVEDAAEALGSTYKGQMAGTFGDIGVFSFNGNKIITGGSGGALITNNEAFGNQARHLIATAKTAHAWETTHDEVGYNYKMTNLVAAIVTAQLEKLSSRVAARRALAKNYQRAFDSVGLTFRLEPEACESNYWLMSLDVGEVESRDSILKALYDENIESKPLWTPMHLLPMYESCQRTELTNTLRIRNRMVTIPSC